MLNRLYEELDAQVPRYSKAREQLARLHRQRDAGDRGENINRLFDANINKTGQEVSAMGKKEQEAFRRGASSGFGYRLDRVADEGDVGVLARTPVAQERIRMASQTPEQGDELITRIKDEADYQKTYNLQTASAGSRTAVLQGGDFDLNFSNALKRYLLNNVNEETADEISNLLMKRLTPSELAALAKGEVRRLDIMPKASTIAAMSGVSTPIIMEAIERGASLSSNVTELSRPDLSFESFKRKREKDKEAKKTGALSKAKEPFIALLEAR